MTVWLLYSRIDYGEPYLYGVFSTAQAGILWLRKSARFMDGAVGPIVPTAEGGRIRLTERFYIDPHEVNPEPIAQFGDGATAGQISEGNA